MLKEFQALEANNTWDIVPPPLNKKVIPCKWVYKIKQKSDGSVERYKARLVIRGDTQKEKIDYNKTFSPVVKFTTIKCLLSLAIKRNWTVYQLDINNVFLHGFGTIHYFLGLDGTQYPEGYIISQQKFTQDLLAEFHCHNFSSVMTPLDTSVKFFTDMGDPLTDPSTYLRIIGKLNFLQHTRPDIFFCVQHLSQFLQAPQVPHMLAALHALRYLPNASTLGILFSSSFDTSIKAYSDSDWAACAKSMRFVSGFYITLGGPPISWKSKKQPTISLSSA
uniref:Uncharacterized mitochondrial protein AtMg00810-like n=1 Tax=Nicotiana tabacum TaxID=4097 RepID=A0A1S4BBR0_TOBAC|nr:PREDICTED: uncharacterized mitochondrial protein AtMg00810-like [Nicotiana tabacum]